MIILASTSKRRIQLIKKITKDFKCIKPNIDEKAFHYGNISIISKELAKMKAYSVYNQHKDDIIISADTIVILNNELIEKPKNKIDAFNILKKLSNNTHIVLTSYTILYKEKEISHTVKTYVTFKKLNYNLINDYLKNNTYKDKAGGYAIQARKYNFVKSINGSYYNVVGFPIDEIKKDLNKLFK